MVIELLNYFAVMIFDILKTTETIILVCGKQTIRVCFGGHANQRFVGIRGIIVFVFDYMTK